MKLDKINLSKIVSYALRHNPEQYSLKLDEYGWTKLDDLYHSIKIKHPEYSNLSIEHFVNILVQFDKKRHEIKDGMIKALYGHSKILNIQNESIAKPPEILYHGTPQKNIDKIMQIGILPMSRKFVHLSDEIKYAEKIAKRFSDEIIIFKVNAIRAYYDGCIFYNEGESVWLIESVSPKYIDSSFIESKKLL